MDETPRANVTGRPVRRIMHCDMDCFFAAVEELDDPSLAGRPVIVGGDPDKRGVVSTANYVARRFGVRSAMSAAQARRLCPHGVFLPPRFSRYRELSHEVMGILGEHFVVTECVSIDEAYGELPTGAGDWRPANLVARDIKRRIREEVGLTVSIGAGQSKSIAKLASDLSKPDGCLVVNPARTLDFLWPLPVGLLHGVGPRTRDALERAGLLTVGQLAQARPAMLQNMLGQHGLWLWSLANGQDDRPVVAEHGPPKSISRERTYDHDIADLARVEREVERLAAHVARSAADQRLPARTVTLKLKWSDFHITTRQSPLHTPTNEQAPVVAEALALLRREFANAIHLDRAVRLVGVGLSGFPTTTAAAAGGWVQLHLFDDISA